MKKRIDTLYDPTTKNYYIELGGYKLGSELLNVKTLEKDFFANGTLSSFIFKKKMVTIPFVKNKHDIFCYCGCNLANGISLNSYWEKNDLIMCKCGQYYRVTENSYELYDENPKFITYYYPVETYGGPEDGGWSFSYYHLIKSYSIDNIAFDKNETLKKYRQMHGESVFAIEESFIGEHKVEKAYYQ